MRKKIIFVEGNLSSGKSTVLRGCKEAGLTVLEEPLDVWQQRYSSGVEGDNILNRFYGDMKRWSFTFEVGVMHTRFHLLREALAHPAELVVIERSPFTDLKGFAENVRASGGMDDVEWKIYIDWYNTFIEHTVKPLLAHVDIEFVFIDTPVETCFHRMKIRDRLEEVNVPPQYLINIDRDHRNWLLHPTFEYKLHLVDGMQTREEVLNSLCTVVENVRSREEQSVYASGIVGC